MNVENTNEYRDIRWKQRYQNFQKAVELLHEPFSRGIENLSDLEKEGTIQRFEVVLELAWKTLKDYLEFSGIVIDPVTPRTVIKEAFAAKVISDAEVWIAMLDYRNLLSHTYSSKTFHSAVAAIRDQYLSSFDGLNLWLSKQTTD